MEKAREGKVWVTGATGFIGRAVISAMIARSRSVVPICRASVDFPEIRDSDCLILKDLVDFESPDLLQGVDCILHLAGLTHYKKARGHERELAFMHTNRDATRALARAAAQAGVRRFVLLSSIGVLGNSSGEHPFDEDSPVAPHNAYTRSKLAAEQELWQIAGEESLEAVVLRAPLVYGPNPKGSLSSLINALKLGIPLPLGSVCNRRSLICLDNLVDALITCIDTPKAADELFLVSDLDVVSTPELIRGLAKAMGTRARLLNVPPAFVSLAAKLLGRSSLAEQLLDNLEINSGKIRNQLDWRPSMTLEQGLLALVQNSTNIP